MCIYRAERAAARWRYSLGDVWDVHLWLPLEISEIYSLDYLKA
mgnify:CR=1 FL=1